MVNHTIRGSIVTKDEYLQHHEIIINDSDIQAVAALDKIPVSSGLETLILPGFRDQHIHDWVGQTMAATQPEEALIERFGIVMQSLAQDGVTGVYLATFGAPLEILERYCHAARKWMDHPDNGRNGAKLLGINIEGTFLNVECRGAQPAEYCLIPSKDDCIHTLDRLYNTGSVKLINIAPDYGEPSFKLIRHASDLGLIVGAGHSKASADHIRKAYEESGLKFMVHFTNGPTGQSFKPFDGGGAFEGAMDSPIHKELIVDRKHVDERYLLDIIRRTAQRWGFDKIIAVTDALFPIKQDIPEEEFAIGSTIAKRDLAGNFLSATAYLNLDGSRIAAPRNTLCSSLLSMDRAFGNLVSIQTHPVQGHWYDHPAMPPEIAFVRAAKLCATHQAMLDDNCRDDGSIAVGKKADLVVGTIKKNGDEYSFKVQETYVEGVKVFGA